MQFCCDESQVNTIPLQMNDEVFVLMKANVGLSVKIDDTQYISDVNVFMSTLRLICKSVNISIELPLATIENEAFRQPIFTANNLSGVNNPLPDSNIANKIEWQLNFRDGVGTFLHFFFVCLNDIRESIKRTDIKRVAFVDPNDTSTLLIPMS